MKGFIHIVEIIIIALVVFLVLIQFTSVPPIPKNFDQTKLSLVGNDILSVLQEKKVNWLNASQVQEEIDILLAGENIVYEVEVRNAVSNPVFVGCLCTLAELSQLTSLLKPMTFNGQNLSFVLEQIPPPSLAEDPTFAQKDVALDLKYHVIVMYDYDLAGTIGGPYDYTTELRHYLKAGKGIVQVRDLNAVKLDPLFSRGIIQRDFFGVTQSPTTPDSSPLLFTEPQDVHLANVIDISQSLPLYDHAFSSTPDLFSPTIGTWAIVQGQWESSGEPAFSSLSFSEPENYTVRFEVTLPAVESEAGWSPGYLGDEDWILAGVSTQKGLIIRNTSTLFSSQSFPFASGETYHLTIHKKGNTLTVQVLNESAKGELTYLIESISGSLGLFSNTTGTNSFDNFRISSAVNEFTNFLTPFETVNISATISNQSMILVQESTLVPALVAKDSTLYNGEFLTGRTAWLSSGATEENELLRSLIHWTAIGSYKLIPNTIPQPQTFTLYPTVSSDFFQPLEVILRLDFTF